MASSSKKRIAAAPALLHDNVRKVILGELERLNEGDRLPPERALSARFKVDRVTVRHALEDLRQEGFVIRQQGRGTFVAKPVAASADMPVGGAVGGAVDGADAAAAVGAGKVVALSVPGIELPIHRRIISAIEDGLARVGASSFICNARLDTARGAKHLEELRRQDVFGAVVVPFGNDSLCPEFAAAVNALVGAGKRVVLFDQYAPGADAPAVMSDRQRIGFMAAEHLIMMGHRRIAYATSGRHDTAGMACLAGYKQALAEYGVEFRPELVIERPLAFSAAPVRDAVAGILGANPKAFTAIATEHFSMTFGIVKALRELGIEPGGDGGGDVAVVGAELWQNDELLFLPHTAQDFEEMGRLAAEALFASAPASAEAAAGGRRSGGGAMRRHALVQPRLVPGDFSKQKSSQKKRGKK